MKCQLPCLTCADNQPTICKSCEKGAYVSGGKCVKNLTCNDELSCRGCGQGLNYYLLRSTTGTTC